MNINDLPTEIVAMGHLEDGETEDRMIVRVLGHKLGSSNGWMHFGGWCVLAPEFVPDDNAPFGLGAFKSHTKLVLLIDYYIGRMLLVDDVAAADQPIDWKVLQTIQLNGW